MIQGSTVIDADVSRGWTDIATSVDQRTGRDIYTARSQAKLSPKYRTILNAMAQRLVSVKPISTGLNTPPVFFENNAATFTSLADAQNFEQALIGVETRQSAFRARNNYQDENIERGINYNKLVPLYNSLPDTAKKNYGEMNKLLNEVFNARLDAVTALVEKSIASASLKSAARSALRQEFESTMLANYYAPLARFGDYWFYGTDTNGKDWFKHFKTPGDRDKFAGKFKAKGGKEIGSGLNIENLDKLNTEGGSPDFILQMNEIINTLQGVSDIEKKNIQQSIYQMYLSKLPEVSVRHSSRHRKGTLGWDEDYQKAFAHILHHSSSQYGNMTEGLKMRESLDTMSEIVKVAGNQKQLAAKVLTLAAARRLKAGWAHFNTPRVLDNEITQARLTGLPAEEAELKEVRVLLNRYESLSAADANAALSKYITGQQYIIDNSKLLTTQKDRESVSDIVTELYRTYDAMLNVGSTAGDQFAGTMRQFGFIWMLGMGISSAVMNLTQTPVVAMSLVRGKYGDAHTVKIFVRVSRDFAAAVTAMYHKDSNGKYDMRDENGNVSLTKIYEKRLIDPATTPAEKQLLHDVIDELQKRKDDGTIERTQSMDVIGIGKDGYLHSGQLQDFSKKMGWMFHHGERTNREITIAAAYMAARLGNEKKNAQGQVISGVAGMTDADASAYAKKTVDFGHGNYDPENAARIFRGWPSAIALQFMKYPQAMLYLYGRVAVDKFNGWKKLPEGTQAEKDYKARMKLESQEASRSLSALFTMQFMMAGSYGLPLVGTLTAVAGFLGAPLTAGAVVAGVTLGKYGAKPIPLTMSLAVILVALGMAVTDDDDEPWDVERELRVGLTDMLGEEAATFICDGLWNTLGVDTASRSSLADIIFRPIPEDKEGDDAALEYLARMGGPTGSLIRKMAKAKQFASRGDYDKAMEQILPKFAGDPLKMYRFATEGVTTNRGAPIREESLPELLFQFAGWGSAANKNFYTERNYALNREQELVAERTAIIHGLRDARINQEPEDHEKRLEWNEKHQGYKIQPTDIHHSIAALKRERKAMSEKGYATNPHLEEELGIYDIISENEDEEEEDAGF